VGGLVAALAAADVTSRVISFDAWRPRSQSQAAPVVQHNALRVSAPGHADAVLDFAREYRADVVHVHDPLLWEAASQLEAPRLYTVHVSHRVLRKARGLTQPNLSERAERRALAEADIVTVPSTAVAADLIPAREALTTPFGISLPRGRTHAPPRNPPRVLFAGRLIDIKGTAALIQAMNHVVARMPSVRLRMASGLAHNPRAERRARQRLSAASSPDLARQTDWLGWLPRAEFAEELALATLVVAPSWYETFGLVVLEAMATGAAVVASDVAGHRAQIAHQRTGWLIQPRDAHALAEAITQLMGAPEQTNELGAAARHHVEQHGQWPARVAAFVAAYRACDRTKTAAKLSR
jgi:glycosyltransferase involved in cell wall biosynthesis